MTIPSGWAKLYAQMLPFKLLWKALNNAAFVNNVC